MKNTKTPSSQVIENLTVASQHCRSTKREIERIEIIAQNGNDGTHYELEKNKIKVDIYLEGGIVQELKSNHDIEVRIFDYDIDGVDDGNH